MALTVIKPSGIDISGNYTVNGMNVSANLSAANLSVTTSANLGAVGNITITGGTSGQVLSTDGSGVLSFITIGTAGVSNGNSNIAIATAGGNVTTSVAGNANILVVTGTGANIAGTANITGNIVGGGELNISGNSIFGGNLTVNGTLTYINSTTLSISDPIINLQTGANGAAPIANTGKDVGTALNYYDTSAKIAWMGWDVSNAEIAFGSNVGISSEVITFTSLANIRSGNANLGNLATANFFTGSGNNLSNIQASNITGQVANALVAGTVYTNAQPNITSVGTLATLSVSGNATVGNLTSGGSGGNISNANVISANTFSASGNITANFFIGNGSQLTGLNTAGVSNGTSNINIPSANGNVNISSAGNANVLIVTGIGTNITGTLSASGNANLANIGTGGLITATGNITGGNLITGGVLSVTGNATVGNISATSGVFTTVAGSLTTAAQSNITSTGTLSSLSVSGTSNLGAVGNVTITGGTNGYVLSTNGSGTLSWVAQSAGGGASISNGTSNINIATSGGNVTTGVNGNANILVVTGTGANVNGTLSVTGQSNLGAVGNVVITGGTANYVLKTDGSGTLSWVAQTPSANITVDNFTGNGVQTIFTLSTTPTSINQTSVNYNGATLLRTDYTLANANITFSSAPANGSLLEVTTINLTSGGGGSSLTIQDEGSNLTTTASLINFVGNGIVATNVGNSVTVTVNTGGGTSSAAAVGYSLIFGG